MPSVTSTYCRGSRHCPTNRDRRPHNAVPGRPLWLPWDGNHLRRRQPVITSPLLRPRARPERVVRLIPEDGHGLPLTVAPAPRFRRRRMPQDHASGSTQPPSLVGGAGAQAGAAPARGDATGVVASSAFTPRRTLGAMVLPEGLVRQWGIPLALYSDRHGNTMPVRRRCLPSRPSSPG